MAMMKDRQLLLAKIQPVIDTDPVPTPADNALMASNFAFSLISRQMERAQSLPWMGIKDKLNIGEGLKISFETEVRGKGGDPDVPPEVGPLLRACNKTETITPDTKVVYVPNSNVGTDGGAEMATIYFYQDKIWHKLLNARGTVQTPMKSGDYVMDKWEFTGVYMGAARVSAIPAGTFNMTLPPRFIAALCTIGGFSPVFESLSLDEGNKVAKRVNANAPSGIQEWMISDRQPKGSIDPEVPELVQASLTTAFAAANSNLKFTAHGDYPGVDGNDISIEFVDTGAVSVTVAGKVITINIDDGVSLASAVKAAFDLVPAAVALCSCAYKAGDTGAGAVAAMAEDNLDGGTGVDFWKRWEDSTGMEIVATVGQDAGNKCKFTCAKAILDAPTYGDRENILTHGLNFSLHPSAAGNDEIIREYS